MSQAAHPEFLALAATRLVEPLSQADEARLAAHLASCASCRRRVAGYEADRTALRALREPTPPRDLWARTSAALDHEQVRRASRAIAAARRAGWRPVQRRRGVVGAAFVVLAAAVLVGSGLLTSGPFGPVGLPEATPLDVQPGNLAYVSTRDGQVGVYVGRISRVCPENTAANCQSIEQDAHKVASFASDFVAHQLTISPDGRIGAVVGASASGEVVYAIRFPDLAGPEASESPSASPSGSPKKSPKSSSGASATPTLPSPSATASASASAGSSPGPEAIIDHVLVVGETPTYSADGTMLAFSAMPADRSAGPDIYVWQVGSAAAVALTDDHGSVFASWAGTSIVGSRAGKRSANGVTPSSFLLDPSTGKTTELARPAWRPIVDPTGRYVIYFDGAIAADADGLTWHEERGGLYLAPWRLFDPTAPAPSEATPAPSGSSTPLTSPGGEATPSEHGSAGTEPPAHDATKGPTGPTTDESPTARPSGSGAPSESPTAAVEPERLVAGRDYERDPVLEWEARWSPDGAWFGAWIGDNAPVKAGSGMTGSLTVAAVDRATGRIDRGRIELDGAPALRDFALGDHRIAWTTLPGSDGISNVRLLVWTDLGRGFVRTDAGGGNDTLPAF